MRCGGTVSGWGDRIITSGLFVAFTAHMEQPSGDIQ